MGNNQHSTPGKLFSNKIFLLSVLVVVAGIVFFGTQYNGQTKTVSPSTNSPQTNTSPVTNTTIKNPINTNTNSSKKEPKIEISYKIGIMGGSQIPEYNLTMQKIVLPQIQPFLGNVKLNITTLDGTPSVDLANKAKRMGIDNLIYVGGYSRKVDSYVSSWNITMIYTDRQSDLSLPKSVYSIRISEYTKYEYIVKKLAEDGYKGIVFVSSADSWGDSVATVISSTAKQLGIEVARVRCGSIDATFYISGTQDQTQNLDNKYGKEKVCYIIEEFTNYDSKSLAITAGRTFYVKDMVELRNEGKWSDLKKQYASVFYKDMPNSVGYLTDTLCFVSKSLTETGNLVSNNTGYSGFYLGAYNFDKGFKSEAVWTGLTPK